MTTLVNLTKEEQKCSEWLALLFVIGYPKESGSKLIARIMEKTKGKADRFFLNIS